MTGAGRSASFVVLRPFSSYAVLRPLLLAPLAALLLGAGACSRPHEPIRFPPVVVVAPYRLPGAVVRGARRDWWKLATGPAHYGEPLPVAVTMYCLKGTTRRGRYVRSGIVAADPRFFPLARYLELYVGRKYLGRFLVDDTGKRIKGEHIDIWTNDCREAKRFGIQRGTAVRVERLRSAEDVRQAGVVASAASQAKATKVKAKAKKGGVMNAKKPVSAKKKTPAKP